MPWFRWRGALLILVAASFWPLHILTVNLFGIVRPERVFGIVVLVWIAGMFLIGVLALLPLDLEAAENTVFVAIVFVMNGGPILREFDGLAYWILIGCPILAGLMFVRLRGHFIVTGLIWGAAIALAVGPIVTFYESWSSQDGVSVVAGSEPISVELLEKPDIFLIVFDGYPGAIASAQDDLDPGRIDITSELRDRGFHVPASSWSSYWTTMLSIPSLLEMNYPAVDVSVLRDRSKQDLQGIIAGDSALLDVLNHNGYTTHMVEAGWSAASCGAAFDACVPSPLLDEATYLILRHTAAWSLLHDSPGPYALGTLAGYDWLLDHAPDLSKSNSADFVFLHVVSPHPPLLLRSDCSVELTYERTGAGFNLPGVSTEMREGYLIEQMDCADKFMVELAEAVNPDDVVIFISDHGTDRRYQANPDNVDWDRESTIERLNNFLAVRLREGCEVEDSIAIPNVFRAVVDCLSSGTVERLPERMWVNPMVELDEQVVDELMGMRAGSG